MTRNGIVLVSMTLLIAACCFMAEGEPTATPCPPATTPERSMPAEAALLRGELAANGVTALEVSAIGMQNCPDIPTADTVSWFTVRIEMDDLTDKTRQGEIVAAVIRSAAAWPHTAVWMGFRDGDDSVGFNFRVARGQELLDQGLTGAPLVDALQTREE